MSIRMAFPLISAMLFTAAACAQVNGKVSYLPERDNHLDRSNPYLTDDHPALCNGDRMYTLKGEQDKKSPSGRRVILHAYTVDGGGSIASRELSFSVKKGEEFTVRSFFLADDRPSLLYRIWEQKTGHVTLFAQSYDPGTLEPDGEPVEIGMIPFDPKTYFGVGPFVEVIASPDAGKLLFYFDKIKSNEVQLVMCWVTDTRFASTWKGVYKVPAQSMGFEADTYFAGDGAVYLVTSAVLLTDESVKEKADGTEKVKVKTNYWKHTSVSVFKLLGEEFRMWDAAIPGGWEKHALRLAVTRDKVYYGSVVSSPGGEDPTHWLVGELGKELDPAEPAVMPFQAGKEVPGWAIDLVVTDDGGGYVIGKSTDHVIVGAFSPEKTLRWQGSMEWGFWDSGTTTAVPFVRDGRLHVGVLTHGSQAGKEDSGKLNEKGVNYVQPVLVTFDDMGKPRAQDLVGKEDGGDRMYDMVRPNMVIMRDHGIFVDHCYAKKKPGLVHVPVL